ncbi:MAG: PQQ-binding-like beta-propeller repeat protein, partial [Myxococcales bacterium]|nr:PQQ-binding-like beta-propeller repeat protein [Myxococcales bacterium]
SEDSPPFYIGMDIGVIELAFPGGEPESIGELQAWSVDAAEEVWTHTFKQHNWGPVLATAGDLVFAGGTNDRYFRAFDADSGKVLWEQRTNSGVVGVPVSYAIDGVQYIAVQSGWGVDAERKQEILNRMFDPDIHVPQGGVLWVFGLKTP